MKKLLTLIVVLTIGLFLSCSNNNDTSSGNNGVNYEFTITVNGVVHKVKGNSSGGIPLASFGSGIVQNRCYASFTTNGAVVLLGINDVTSPNYISGQNMQVQIVLQNPLLGTNQALISFTGNYFDTLATSLGAYIYSGFNSYSSTLVAVNGGSRNQTIPIVITDLGTPTTLVNNGSTYSFGQTIKGNYSGTIYLQRCSNLGTSSGGCYYDIPVQLSIDFKALRIN
jgi:hypothetical protein